MNRRTNDLAPISQLPVEIFNEIFFLHQQNTMMSDYYRRESEVVTVNWIGITHVCQQWREIALNLPRLWIHLPLMYPDWTKEMIERSKSAGLIVRVSDSYPRKVDALKELLLPNFSRFEVLDVQRYVNAHVVEELFEDIKPTSVPHLSTLILSTEERVCLFYPLHEWLQIMDSQLLNTHSLKRVEAPFTLRWDLGLFTGLTHLKLGHKDSSRRYPTSQLKFLDALRRMPTLECLDLKDHVLPNVVYLDALEPVDLPNLQDLRLCDWVDIIEFFLVHVSFPATARISIGCKSRRYVLLPEKISPVVDLLQRLVEQSPHARKIHHIEVTFSEGRAKDDSCYLPVDYQSRDIVVLKFKGWVSSESPARRLGSTDDSDALSSKPDFTFLMKFQPSPDLAPDDINALFVSTFRMFPREDVVSFSLRSGPMPCDASLEHFACEIGQLPALERLAVNHTSFLLELDLQYDDPSFPALRYLDFTDCEIDVPDLTMLYECLKDRTACRLGPEKLRMDLRGLGEVDRNSMSLLEQVADVVWVMVPGSAK
ncbi:hypothetical protein M413DRAFT_32185 [Hebeloma cylindrosporum]|uniref:Uncharacterized protein n=1 Tax=Hebeloma cylindrosporum TaxID=76867 RepID=A0A0C3BUR5_HEBCY|nr:hypothetical protein M413DRAFT_32185 [Hebeloma cylindrosporum h7]